ncbi:translocation/assembly module TamB domain-containing protein [Maribacter polysaccharolyticus]|uniref:translocation/assembly module TamB domain-containing protein n=1 Tax=Maribacter polysaccharolyticus TaxID=3020831 RepID=UPI00237F5876|nr:translocation/assembly module TamB domain-containing protein [Maribacter polysaccharolyticus]MDE3743545.1 translocation/assembly module TamB [Maribacter polysaccharolyticus]
MLLICVLGTIILSLPFVQTRFAKYATNTINKEFGTNINIDEISLSLISWDVAIKGIYIEDYQKDTLFFINRLETSVLSARNLAKGRLEFGDIGIDGLNFKLTTYKDSLSTNLEVFIDKLDDKKPRDPDTAPFYFSSSHVDIANSAFRLTDENLENKETLDFRGLNISSEDFLILGPNVSTAINAMSFVDKRNIEVKKLATKFKYTKQQMRFDTLNIETPESKLIGNLVFDYERKDFKDFLDKVKITAEFSDSNVSLDEVNLLYNQFGKGKMVSFSSKVNGVLNDLDTDDLFLLVENTGVRGDFNFKNLFTKDKPFVLKAQMKNVTSTYYELRALMPNFLGSKSMSNAFSKFGQFTVRGSATVTESSVYAKVNLNTAIGSSYTDLELTDFNNIENAAYKGFVSLIDFDLGDFVDNKNLGKTTLDFNVEGKGFVKEKLNTEVIGEVYSINFNNYNYKNLKVSGILKEQLFDGSIFSNDPNIRFNFKGLADFGEDRNNFNFIANVEHADLKRLNFIKDSVSVFKGNVNIDISGNSLDNIVGDIKFTKTIFQNINDTYYFDDFKVSSSFEGDSIRTIDINSPDIITGYMKGNFRVKELGRLVQNSIGSIYTNYRPFEISDGQTLAFNFKIYNKIVDVFFPEVQFDPNTFIRGNIIADEGDFKLTFKSPSIMAFGNEADNIDIKIDNKNPLFNTYIAVGDLSTSYYDVKDFNLINTTLKDTLFFRVEFKGGSEYNDSYNLNFYHTFNKQNSSVIGLKKSDISFKNNTWILNKEGNTKNKVILNNTLDSIRIEEIVMDNNEREQIRLRGQLADSTFKDLQLQFKIVSLDKITPSIDSLKLGGEVNGTLNVLQKDEVYLPSSNLEISDFSVNDMRLGDLLIGIVGNRDLTDFVVNAQITDKGEEKLSVIGNIENKTELPQANLMVNFNGFALEPFSPLGEGVITNIRGELQGSARFTGDIDNPDFSGLLTLDNAGLAIPYLNVDYGFARGSRVRLSEQSFNFEKIGITDVARNTKATLDGSITHSFFKDWVLDLRVDTNNDRLLILDTPFEEEVLYYGTGFLNGTGHIFGSTKALTINVDGKTAKGTSLKIPLSDVTSVGDYSYIKFIEKDETDAESVQRVLEEIQGLEMEFNLDVTPDAEVEIVTDQKTGSSLKGTGEGLLLIRINTKDRFEMFGDFVVVTGEFNYKFGGIINKTFKVKPGGTIVWDRDPLSAQLNMEAVYSLNANPAPLLEDSGYTKRIATDVVIKLTEELESPEIDFNIEFPGTSSMIKSELEYSLQDPQVEEKNAIFLLAQGTFVNDQSGINSQAVTGNLIQSASGLLNQVLSGGNDKFNLGLSYEQGILDSSTDIETENRIGVTVSTQISDRVLLNGKVGVPVGGTTETVVAGDFELQLLLNEEGTLSAKFFNRENEIQAFFGDTQGYTQGVGLSYEVDFNSFKELMQKMFKGANKEKKQKKNDPVPNQVMGRDSLLLFQEKSKG